MRIKIEKYSSYWPLYFEKERVRIAAKLHQLSPIIEHIGSTAIPDLIAKPTLDILIGIPEEKSLDDSIAGLQSLGYIYVEKFNSLMPYRRFFIKVHSTSPRNKERRKVIGPEDILPNREMHPRTHHIHLVHRNTQFYNKHIAFRNHLRKNASDREMYALLKQQLAQQEWESGEQYAQAKSQFIGQVLRNLGY
ncbi:MAG: GrpB family protein [Aureispira sp.]|nr:GrpB family protein [Aureispira sp.]